MCACIQDLCTYIYSLVSRCNVSLPHSLHTCVCVYVCMQGVMEMLQDVLDNPRNFDSFCMGPLKDLLDAELPEDAFRQADTARLKALWMCMRNGGVCEYKAGCKHSVWAYLSDPTARTPNLQWHHRTGKKKNDVYISSYRTPIRRHGETRRHGDTLIELAMHAEMAECDLLCEEHHNTYHGGCINVCVWCINPPPTPPSNTHTRIKKHTHVYVYARVALACYIRTCILSYAHTCLHSEMHACPHAY